MHHGGNVHHTKDEYNDQRPATTQTVGSMEQAGSYLPAAVRGMSRRATVGPAARDRVTVVSRCTNLRSGGIVAGLKDSGLFEHTIEELDCFGGRLSLQA